VSAAAGRPRALVVDDDRGVRYTIREILEGEGLEVAEAEDGLSALDRVEGFRPELVLTDLRMPGIDGMELLRRLVARPAAPRVILITAHGSERQAVLAMKAGAYDYFRKPFEIEELLAVVRRAVEALHLRAENERLRVKLAQAEAVIDVQGKVHALLEEISKSAAADDVLPRSWTGPWTSSPRSSGGDEPAT